MSQIDLLIQLKEQLLVFLDELIEILPQEPDLVIARIFLKDRIQISLAMDYIVNDLVPLKPLIDNRDDNFFLENNILFGTISDTKVNHFKKIWNNGSLDREDKETIWKWFKSFIYLAERYSKLC